MQRHALVNEASSACPVPLALEPLDPAEAGSLSDTFVGMEPWSRYPFDATALMIYLSGEEAGAPRYAIKAGEQTVGVAGLRLNWLRGPYLQFLALVPQAQGFGLGSLVMEWLDTQTRKAGDFNIWVCASDFNEGAIGFYERHGFRHVGNLPDLIEPSFTEILMRKRLA